MVAPKRGRGGAQKKNVKPSEEVSQPEPQPEEVEATEENNGDAQTEAQDEGATGEGAPEQSESVEQTEAEQTPATEEAKSEEPKEEKVESGKLLVENLPSSYLFDYQDKLKELFSKYGEINSVKRGPIIVTELTTTPTLSAIVEFKNKESLEKALGEDGTELDGRAVAVAVESSAETAVLVGVPYEASSQYVRLLFAQCGEVAHIHEFTKTKFKILRVTFHSKEAVEKALKLDRELRLNGFLVTVSKYRDDDDQKSHANTNKGNKRQHGNANRNSSAGSPAGAPAAPPAAPAGPAARNNSFRARGAAGFNARGNFRGGARGRGFGGRGGAFPRGGFAPVNSYLPPQGFMARPSYL